MFQKTIKQGRIESCKVGGQGSGRMRYLDMCLKTIEKQAMEISKGTLRSIYGESGFCEEWQGKWCASELSDSRTK